MGKKDFPDQAPENILVAIKEEQARSGYLSRTALERLAESFHVPASEVYGVASFYSLLATRPMGRNVIRICRSLPCYLKDCQIVIDTIKQEIGIEPGQTTADGRFSFELTNCIGLCDRAPAMLINSDAHVDLTPEKISRVLKSYQ
jgi:NADH-quinone oxidoreductase subunit E